MTTSDQEKPYLPALRFNSAAVFADECPRIAFPAPAFAGADKGVPHPGVQLEVTPASLAEMRAGFVGRVTGELREGERGPVVPRYVELVLPPREFDELCERVRLIRDQPLTFELEVDGRGRLVRARYDERDCVHPQRHRSGVEGPLDFEIEETG